MPPRSSGLAGGAPEKASTSTSSKASASCACWRSASRLCAKRIERKDICDMTYDPGRLTHKLKTLSQEFSGWSFAAHDIMRSADYTQKLGEELLSQAKKRAQL